MKQIVHLVNVKSKKSKEFEQIFSLFNKKISNFAHLKIDEIKSFEVSRDQKEVKVDKESVMILQKLKSSTFIILCDESGVDLNSIDFAKTISEKMEIYKQVSLVIGGAFGVNNEVRKKADLTIKLSPFVLNHLVAKVVLLEQIYRTFMIICKKPYHNK